MIFHAETQEPSLPPILSRFSEGILETNRPIEVTNMIAFALKNFDQASAKHEGEKYSLEKFCFPLALFPESLEVESLALPCGCLAFTLARLLMACWHSLLSLLPLLLLTGCPPPLGMEKPTLKHLLGGASVAGRCEVAEAAAGALSLVGGFKEDLMRDCSALASLMLSRS